MSHAKPKSNGVSKKAPPPESDSGLSSEDEKPLAKQPNVLKNGRTAKPRKSLKEESDEESSLVGSEEESEEEKPLAKKKVAPKPRKSSSSVTKTAAAKKVKAEPPASDEELPLAKGKRRKSGDVNPRGKDVKVKKEAEAKVKREKKVKE